MLLFDGELHGSIHSCSFSRRNAVLKQTTRRSWADPLGCVSLSPWDLVDLGAEFVSGEYTAAWRSEPELLVALHAARRERRVD